MWLILIGCVLAGVGVFGVLTIFGISYWVKMTFSIAPLVFIGGAMLIDLYLPDFSQNKS